MAELQKSLQTTDLVEAKRRCLAATAWFRATVERLRAMGTPTRSDLEAAARTFFSDLVDRVDRPRTFPRDEVGQAIAWNVHLSAERIAELEGQLRLNDYDGEVRKLATAMLVSLGVQEPDLESVEGVQAQQLAARAVRQQMAYLIHQLTTPAKPFQPDDEAFQAALSQSRPQGSSLPLHADPASGGLGPLLGSATAQYLRKMELRRLGQSQIDETARLLGWLKQEFGEDRPLRSIRRDEVKKFRDDLQRIDVTLRGRAAPFRDRLTNDAERQVKSATYLRYWNAAQTFFAWCFNELVDAPDPAAGLTIDKRKRETKRTPEPFSKEELMALFKTPLFIGYKSRSRVRFPGPVVAREGHWWAAVLLMFTGMRAGELSQLLPGDFAFDAEVPHVKVREENDEGERVKSAKNLSSIRDVPLHPDLLSLGLRQFVASRGKKYPKDRVFREFRVAGRGRWSDGMTRFWRDYLHDVGLWKEGRATHVWRHTVVACLRANGAAEEDIAAFVGHAGRTITSKYGGDQALQRKAKTAQLLNYGFDVVATLGGPYDQKRHSA